MFSTETNELGIDASDLTAGNASTPAKLFAKLSEQPKLARRVRLSHFFNLSAGGVKNITSDPRSQTYFCDLISRAPFAGYFIHADPPTFHLRSVTLAVAASRGQCTDTVFLQVHHELFTAAAQHCDVVGDDADKLEDAFIANLHWEILRQSPKLQTRVMRVLSPALILSLSASPGLRAVTFREAAKIWGHEVREFSSSEAYVRAFAEASEAGAP